jgi:hypothetical protein
MIDEIKAITLKCPAMMSVTAMFRQPWVRELPRAVPSRLDTRGDSV